MRAPPDTTPVSSGANIHLNPSVVPGRNEGVHEFARTEVPPTTALVSPIENQHGSNLNAANDWLSARAPNGATYWYSRSTKQTTWKDPQSTAAEKSTAAPSTMGSKEVGQTYPTSNPAVDLTEESASNLHRFVEAGALSHSASPAGNDVLMSSTYSPALASSPIPVPEANSGSGTEPPIAMWRAIRTEDGRTYYHDRVSNRTQWECPANFMKDDIPTENSSDPLRLKRAEQPDLFVKPNAGMVVNSLPLSVEASLKSRNKGDTDAAINILGPPSISSLPVGWSQYQTPDGRAYYYHAGTKETRWNRPTASGPELQPTIAPDSTVLNSPPPIAPTSILPLKRTAIEQPADLPEGAHDNWVIHLTPQGRQYYFNPQTRVTSWSLPLGATVASPASQAPPLIPSAHTHDDSQSPQLKRARAESPIGATSRTKRKVGPTRRPRDADGNPMTDRAAEAYFLKRAEILQVSPNSNGDELVLPVRTRKEKTSASASTTSLVEKTQSFYTMLEEAAITAETPWLDVMARCAGDSRYTGLEKYGIRKDAWHKYRAKYERLAHRAQILDSRKKAACLIDCLEEHVVDVDDRVLSFHRCPPRVIQDVEDDPRYKEVSDPTRASILKVFFAKRARLSAALRARRRKDVLAHMAEALEDRIDPALTESVHGGEGKIALEERNDVNDDGNVGARPGGSNPGNIDKGVKGNNKMNIDDNVNENGGDKHSKAEVRVPIFSERTSYRELDQFLQTMEGYGDISSEDVSDLIHRWQRRVDMLCEERAVRERERRKTKLRENRAKFRHGVLNMVLCGKVPFTAHWKEVSDLVCEEDFARPEVELGSRLADLFEDGLRLFEERVQKRRDEFKRLIKENNVDVNDQTTLETLSILSSLKSFLGDVEKPIAQALLVDRQRKESKRRKKEREKLEAEFRQIIFSSDLPADVTFEECMGRWANLPVYKQLTTIGAQDTMRRDFDEYLRFRRSKDDSDRRLKRKLELDETGAEVASGMVTGNVHSMANVSSSLGIGGMSAIARAPRMDGLSDPSSFTPHDRLKRLRVSGMGATGGPPFSGTLSRDEETGWAAVVSEKQLTDEQKAADRERRKQEILKSFESGKSTTHSQV